MKIDDLKVGNLYYVLFKEEIELLSSNFDGDAVYVGPAGSGYEEDTLEFWIGPNFNDVGFFGIEDVKEDKGPSDKICPTCSQLIISKDADSNI